MTWLLLLLISGMNLAAVFFDVRLLRTCFKYKSKYEFLKWCRVLALCQGACQVIILVADSVEWWNGSTILPGETCSFFRVLCLSVMFYQTCNLTAMMTVYLEHPEGNEKKVPLSESPNICRTWSWICRLRNDLVAQLFLSFADF